MMIGYARVSKQEQILDRQIDALKKYGCEKIYTEKMTGTKKDRPALNELLEYARENDSLVVESLSRLSRSTKDLISLMELLNSRKINLVSLKENIDTNSATGKFVFTIMSALAQMERDILSERTKEGLAAARARGREGGRPSKNKRDIDKAIKLYNSKEYSIKEIHEMTGISKSTLYKYLNK